MHSLCFNFPRNKVGEFRKLPYQMETEVTSTNRFAKPKFRARHHLRTHRETTSSLQQAPKERVHLLPPGSPSPTPPAQPDSPQSQCSPSAVVWAKILKPQPLPTRTYIFICHLQLTSKLLNKYQLTSLHPSQRQ